MPRTSRYSRSSLLDARSRLQLRERLAGGLLLGRLLRLPLPDAELLAVDERCAREVTFVRRTLRRENGVRHLPPAARERLLQLGLVVDVRRLRVVDPRGESVDDRLLDVREAVLEEERAEHRLEQRREDVAVEGEALELPGLQVGLLPG